MRARASAEARFSLRCARRPFPPLLPGVSQVTCQRKANHWNTALLLPDMHLTGPLGAWAKKVGLADLAETDMAGGEHVS